MSRVTPAQVSFNGGEVSQRLRARVDQSLYEIAVAEMVGFAPLTEGPMEAMPGFLLVAAAAGACRLFRFEAYATQGHVVEASELKFRVYTNDALIESSPGVALEVASPFSYAKVQGLNTHVSYDVMYCFDGDGEMAPREFRRDDATSFSFVALEFDDGPFEAMNGDDTLTLTADGHTGTITLTASASLFAASDVGRLVRFETQDFGSIKAWEPGITVNSGEIRASEERAYTAASTGRTGGLQPTHTEGSEYDGMAAGTDINSNPAPGVLWDYTHDRYGYARISAFTSATEVDAEVLRRLPFTSAPATTWRWSLGAFSDTTGYPQCGTIWNERFSTARGNRIDCSVVGDIAPPSFETLNEFGEVSADMAFSVTLDRPNPVLALIPDDGGLVALTADGPWKLLPRNPAAAIGPNNVKFELQNDKGAAAVPPAMLDGRTLYAGKGGRRVLELDFDASRALEGSIDLTRYARHIGKPGLTALAVQQVPLPFVWAVRGDGTLACASYNPDEQVLGFARRPLATGILAKSLATCTDPTGVFDQLWLAATWGGDWYVLRMGEWREDGDSDTEAVMCDMAYSFDGAATDTFAVPALAGEEVHVAADGRFYVKTVPGSGNLVLDQEHERAMIGLPFDAYAVGLPIESGGDSGPAMGKKGQVSRAWVKLLDARGLKFGAAAGTTDGDPVAAEVHDVTAGQSADSFVWPPYTGFHYDDAVGEHVDDPALRIERVLPAQATIMAWGCRDEVQQK